MACETLIPLPTPVKLNRKSTGPVSRRKQVRDLATGLMGPKRKRVWFYPARELEGPWLGVRGCRPPIWLGCDEHDRRTLVFQLPGVGAMVVALR